MHPIGCTLFFFFVVVIDVAKILSVGKQLR